MSVTPTPTPTPAPAPTEPRSLRADARRNHELILAAAAEVFARDGPEAQMDDIARQAGLGVGTLYRHFPTKLALMAALVERKLERFIANAEEVLARPEAPFTGLAGLLRRNAEEISRDGATRYAMSAGSEVWALVAEAAGRLDAAGRELVRRAQAAGELRPDFTSADIPLVMCGVASSIDRGLDWRRHLQLMLDGMSARAVG